MPALPRVALQKNPEKWAREATLERLEAVRNALSHNDIARPILSRILDERLAAERKANEKDLWVPFRVFPTVKTVAISDKHDQMVPAPGMVFSIGEVYRSGRETFYVVDTLTFKRRKDVLPAYFTAYPLKKVDYTVSASGPMGASFHYETRNGNEVLVEPRLGVFYRNARLKTQDQFTEKGRFREITYNVPVPVGNEFRYHD
jgi:hypothetical protein